MNLGNAFAGVWINNSSAVNNRLGNGTAAGGNDIDNNGQLGISLGDGITPNPNEVSLFSGPNNLQNYPVLTSVVTFGGTTTISGTYDFPNGIQAYTLEFFSSPAADPSGFGEGAQWEGTTSVLTDASGHATFSVPIVPAVLAGRVVTAIATDPNGNSSEFSGAAVQTVPVELQRFDAE